MDTRPTRNIHDAILIYTATRGGGAGRRMTRRTEGQAGENGGIMLGRSAENSGAAIDAMDALRDGGFAYATVTR